MLERPRLIDVLDWSVTDTFGPLTTFNLDVALASDPYYYNILKQFSMYRCDYEVSVRINTNQMYFGALMVTLFPGELTEDCYYLQQRSVLNPVVVSAMTEGTATVTLKYPFPWEWCEIDSDKQFVRCTVDVISPLTKSTASLGDSVSVTLTGRFVNPRVLLNKGQPIALQSAHTEIKSRAPKPFIDAQVYADQMIDTIEKPVKFVADMVDTVGTALPMITSVLSLFDKPESIKEAQPRLISHAQDLACVDRPIYSPLLGLYQDDYVAHKEDVMPFRTNWTFSEYAQIPGLIREFSLTNSSPAADIQTSFCPMTYAMLSHVMWRGSTKYRLDFYTSIFTTARLIIRLQRDSGDTSDTDWQNCITRVVDVKGDTSVEFTVPYINNWYWSPTSSSDVTNREFPVTLRVYPMSRIVSSDASVEPTIHCVVWQAAGPDFQVAGPRVVDWPTSGLWTGPLPVEMQAAMHEVFSKDFIPFADGSAYSTDSKYCTSDASRAVTDVLKRYQYVSVVSNYPTSTSIVEDQNWGGYQFAKMFLMHRGGLNLMTFYPAGQSMRLAAAWGPSIDENRIGGTLLPDSMGVMRATLPQIMQAPFTLRSSSYKPFGVGMRHIGTPSSQYAAVRDDWMLAFPVLPPPVPVAVAKVAKTGLESIQPVPESLPSVGRGQVPEPPQEVRVPKKPARPYAYGSA